MKILKKINFLALLILLAAGCSSKEPEIFGNGIKESEVFELPPVEALDLEVTFPVILTQGEQEISLEGDSNILPWVMLRVQNEELKVSFEKGVNLRDFDLVLKVSLPKLKALRLGGTGDAIFASGFALDELLIISSGTGNVISEVQLSADKLNVEKSGTGDIDLNLTADLLKIDAEGTGDLFLKGTSAISVFNIEGTVQVRSFELQTHEMFLDHASTGKAEIFVQEYLQATINSTGDIFYKGTPEVDLTKNGTGDLIHLDNN